LDSLTPLSALPATMLPQRVLVRSTQRLARAPVAQTAFRKRPYSSGPSGLTGAADNEFNRERLAVKQHATETSGEFNAGLGPLSCLEM
jgi:hypothetical protein